MKIKRLICLGLAVLMVMGLCACSKKSAGESANKEGNYKLLNDGVLSVGVEVGYPPFEYLAEDGTTAIGFDMDLAEAIAEKLGVKAQIISTSWDGIFQGIDVNYDVVISGVTITDERKETMLFSDPYIQNYQTVVVLADSNLEVKDFTDLDGLTLAVQKETTSDILMSDYISTGSINSTLVPNEKLVACFSQLENKEIDAVVVDSSVAAGYIAANPDKYKVAYTDKSEPQEFGIAMGKNNTELQTAINNAIAELKEEGYFDDSIAHWFGSEE